MATFTPPANPGIDAAVLARRQKDLEGYLDTYRNIMDQRQVKYAAEIRPFWLRVNRNITAELKAVYKELQDANGVPIIKQPIQEAKYRNMQRKIKHLATMQQWLAKMLKVKEQDVKLGHNLAYDYSRAYYYNAFALEQAAQVQVAVPMLAESQVMGILANPWLPDGGTYSERIRANTVYLAGKMEKTMVEAVGNGWDWNRTARRIQDVAGEGYLNSVRLARTELNRAAAQGANDLYMQNADILDNKRWNATLDSRTAPKDARNDGKVYPLEYDTPEVLGKPGERIPNHPNCRCSWTPVLSALGVSTKERIARGDGDSTDKFGERIYTKARTYEEYAKERGLPSLEERLANDNPKSYLRRGESLSAYGSIVGVLPGAAAAAVAAIPVVETWVDKFKKSIPDGGITSEVQVRELGAQVREQLEKETSEQMASLEKEIAEIQAARTAISDKVLEAANAGLPYEHMYKEYDELDARLMKLYDKQANGGLDKVARAERIRDTIKQLRPVGTNGGQVKQPWTKGSRKEIKATLEEVREFLPTAWLEKSSTSEILTKASKRGFYRQKWGKETAIISLSGQGASGLRRVAFHELGHRFEDVVPGIFKLEREFYRRRTAGESLQWLGPGYKTSETSRFDKFLSKYMGKEYRDDYHELLSMGLESLYTGSYDLAKDQDFYDFILGLVSAV